MKLETVHTTQREYTVKMLAIAEHCIGDNFTVKVTCFISHIIKNIHSTTK